MKFKNKELEILCMNLYMQRQQGDQIVFFGLLTENITLGLKRRLEKIRKEAIKHYEQYQADIGDVRAAIEKKAAEKLPEGSKVEDYKTAKEGTEYRKVWLDLLEGFKEELVKELRELGEEEVEITSEQVTMALIEKVETKNNYDWEFIERIAV